MRIDFVYGHGSGNAFPIVDARALDLTDADWAVVARALADRRGAVGGDGLLLLTAEDRKHAFGMRMFNSDGSEAETCLNGLRLVARMGFEAVGGTRATVRLKTSAAEVSYDPEVAPGVVTIRETAGPASLDVAAWPADLDAHEIVDAPVAPLSSTLVFTAVAMPNPHFIGFVETIDERELVRVGAICEAAPAWLPNRANVSFVERRGADALFVRTFERGVGLTDSCGSAMAASTFAAALTGRIGFGDAVTVYNKGGLVRAGAQADGMVTLSGNATYEWAGSAEIDMARGVAGDVVAGRHFNDEIAAWARVVERAAR